MCERQLGPEAVRKPFCDNWGSLNQLLTKSLWSSWDVMMTWSLGGHRSSVEARRSLQRQNGMATATCFQMTGVGECGGGAVFSEVGRGRRGEGERTGQNIFGSAALKATTAEGNFLVKEIVNENQRVLLEKKKFPSWVYRKLSNWRAGQPTGVVNTSSVYFSSKTQYKEWKTKMPRNLAVTGRQLHPFRRSH